MDDAVRSHELKGGKHLYSKSTDEDGREPRELIRFDQFVQVYTEHLGDDAEMASKVEVFGHPDHVVAILRVPFDELLQYLDLNQSLGVKPLFIPNDLDCG